MKKVLFFRKKDLIIPVDERESPDFKKAHRCGSLNKAKKQSHKIQLENGGLRMGSVRVLR